MATQAEVDEITAAISQVKTDLATASANVQAELNAIEASVGQDIDLTKLKEAVAPLDEAAVALGNLKPIQPAPAPTPPAAPAATEGVKQEVQPPANAAPAAEAQAETPAEETAEGDVPGQPDADDAPANAGQGQPVQ